VQAGFRTGLSAGEHGMIGNGIWDRKCLKARFWEQSSRLVAGERIWQKFRAAGGRVGMLFWQQSLGEDVDVVLSPAPIHKHHGGMVQDCYSQPSGLYADLCRRVGRKFSLMNYWGPMASHKSSAWIAQATAALLADRKVAPDLCLTYLPVLDYDLQRYGVGHERSQRALEHALNQLQALYRSAQANDYEFLAFGDYALENVTGGPVYPNRALKKAGLLRGRKVGGMEYADFYTSRAFAMVDHEVAHVYVPDEANLAEVSRSLAELPGVAEVLDGPGQADWGIRHANAGELVLVAEPGRWFAYPWWDTAATAPDYASHVDIHNKPGYDPAELFWGWPPGSVSQRPERIGGTHGRAGSGRKVAWASSVMDGEYSSVLELARAVKTFLEG
jgi:predicted AlkP superfamily pyrophosphatase or phosphodiesterase